jgi:hypothetical protein
MMRIRDLFVSDVTRDIPPVVYFHEQSPQKVAAEVSEYIITGGWPEGHPNNRRVPDGIHEQYVRLLTYISRELSKPGGPDHPAAWISGFYGSGKSSFAKLLGLALDGMALPNGTSLAEAWLNRDMSLKAAELRDAWRVLRQKIEPLAVVFDIGGAARDGEHIHAAAVRQVQRRLGYCANEPLVANFELRLERDGEWPRFERIAQKVLGKSWASVKGNALAEEDFSHVMSEMYPERYSDPMSWFTSRGGTHTGSESPEEAVAAIRDMLAFRQPSATLFLVIDEVSQYVLSSTDRVDRLRAFATAIGSTLRGKAWLLALGQQKLDEDADDSFLIWAKDRFPLRVHLAATNIRDVVHRRLLQKKSSVEPQLRELFEQYRPDLKLYAYGCESITPDEFVEVYPMLPGQIDLILRITSALRTRSNRAQGDDQAIRGLLQLLGELFRDQKLADEPVRSLISLDRIYEVQHTALDSDVQASMARILAQCAGDAEGLMVRAAKTVALLELIQDNEPTDAKLVAQCLYDRVDRGNQLPAVTEALEELRRRNLLGYSEKYGYKVQSSAGEEWERERRDFGVAREAISEIVRTALSWLLETSERPRLQGRPFPWLATFSDGRRVEDVVLDDTRDDAAVHVDFRFLTGEERIEGTWIRRSSESALLDRFVWVAGDSEQVDHAARDLARSRAMVRKYKPRRESLNAARKRLLQDEESRIEDLEKLVRDAVADAWMAGKIYFRGRSIAPYEHGMSFAVALHAAATRELPNLFQHFTAAQVEPSELRQLLEGELSGPSPKFMPGDLGILELDRGRYVATCSGIVPRRVQEHIETEGGLSGTTLLSHFGRPPYGYTANVVKACVAGLLRAGKVRLDPEGGTRITAIRDAGVRDTFDKERAFRRASIFPAGEDDIGPQARARICTFFEDALGMPLMEREDHAIADAVARHFPQLAQTLRAVQDRLNRLPGSPRGPEVLSKLGDILEECIRECRQTEPTVSRVKKHLDVLRDGVERLQLFHAELTDGAIRVLSDANKMVSYQAVQLKDLGVEATNAEAAALRIREQLGSEWPWRDLADLGQDVHEIRAAYVKERQRLLQWQEQQVEDARSRLKARDGFSTLTADQAHRVLRPPTQAVSDTDVEAIAPALNELRSLFLLRLHGAEEEANQILDAILSEGKRPRITRVDLSLHNRELATEADVEALVSEIRTLLLQQMQGGVRVRLL